MRHWNVPGHMLKHVREHVVGHMLEHLLMHVPVRNVLEHVTGHALRQLPKHVPTRHVLEHVPQNRFPELPSYKVKLFTKLQKPLGQVPGFCQVMVGAFYWLTYTWLHRYKVNFHGIFSELYFLKKVVRLKTIRCNQL